MPKCKISEGFAFLPTSHALEKKLQDVNCITNHRNFPAVCLTPAVLHIVVNSLEEVCGYGVVEDWSNKQANQKLELF